MKMHILIETLIDISSGDICTDIAIEFQNSGELLVQPSHNNIYHHAQGQNGGQQHRTNFTLIDIAGR